MDDEGTFNTTLSVGESYDQFMREYRRIHRGNTQYQGEENYRRGMRWIVEARRERNLLEHIDTPPPPKSQRYVKECTRSLATAAGLRWLTIARKNGYKG